MRRWTQAETSNNSNCQVEGCYCRCRYRLWSHPKHCLAPLHQVQASNFVVSCAGAHPAVNRCSAQPSRGGGLHLFGRRRAPFAAAAATPPAGVAPQGASPTWGTGCTCFCFNPSCCRYSCMHLRFISLLICCPRCRIPTECMSVDACTTSNQKMFLCLFPARRWHWQPSTSWQCTPC